MLPHGSAPLMAMRKSGQRPAGVVWLTVGDFSPHDWRKVGGSPELLIRPEDPIGRLDLRCLVGLEVILFSPDWTDRVSAIYERLQEYAAEIAVMSPAFDLDIGWRWRKGVGQLPFFPESEAA